MRLLLIMCFSGLEPESAGTKNFSFRQLMLPAAEIIKINEGNSSTKTPNQSRNGLPVPAKLRKFQRIGSYFVVRNTGIENIAGEIDGRAEGILGSNIFSCNVVTGSMIGRGSDYRQSGCKVHAAVK